MDSSKLSGGSSVDNLVTRQYAWKVFDDSSQQPASCRANLSFAGRGVRRSTAGGFLGYSSIVKESEWLWAG